MTTIYFFTLAQSIPFSQSNGIGIGTKQVTQHTKCNPLKAGLPSNPQLMPSDPAYDIIKADKKSPLSRQDSLVPTIHTIYYHGRGTGMVLCITTFTVRQLLSNFRFRSQTVSDALKRQTKQRETGFDRAPELFLRRAPPYPAHVPRSRRPSSARPA